MFCSNCGKEATGKFCSSCGAALDIAATSAEPQQQTSTTDSQETILWEGQPDGIMDKVKTTAKVNSTHYKITNQRIVVNTGLIGKKQEEIELYRVKDYKVTQTLSERLINVGNLIIIAADSTTPRVILSNIKNPNEVKEILRKAVLDCKQKMNVSYKDIM